MNVIPRVLKQPLFPEIKAIIFDLDNTLIDFSERKKLVIKEVVKAMIDAGINEPFEKLHAEFSEYYWNRIEDQQIFQKFLKKRYGKVDFKVLAYAILAYRKVNTGLLRPYPGAKHLLRTLCDAGYKLAVLSDAPKLEAYLRICGVGIEYYFDTIITVDDVNAEKPSKKGFLLAAKKLGVKPEECVMVGDNTDRDILGAKRLGMKSVFAKYGSVKKKDGVGADFIAESPYQIAEYILHL